MGKITSKIKYTTVINTVDLEKNTSKQLTAIGLTFREVQDLYDRKCNKTITNKELVQSNYAIEYCPNNIGYANHINNNMIINMFYYTNTK